MSSQESRTRDNYLANKNNEEVASLKYNISGIFFISIFFQAN
jgi:hypothetical protein